MSRFIGFVENLTKSKIGFLRMIFNICSADLRSLFGQNLKFLQQKYSKCSIKELIQAKKLVKTTCANPLPRGEAWKVNLVEEIALCKLELIEVDFDSDDLEEILELICTE